MSSHAPPTGVLATFSGDINWTTMAASALLLDSGYDYAITDQYVTDVVAHEAVGTGYVRQALGSKTLSTTYPFGDGITYQIGLMCANIAFSAVTIADWEYLAIYDNTGDDTTSQLLMIYDLTAQVMTDPDDLTFIFPDGVLAYLGA